MNKFKTLFLISLLTLCTSSKVFADTYYDFTGTFDGYGAVTGRVTISPGTIYPTSWDYLYSNSTNVYLASDTSGGGYVNSTSDWALYYTFINGAQTTYVLLQSSPLATNEVLAPSGNYYGSNNATLSLAAAPEIDGSLAPKVGFLLGCLFLMFGRRKQIDASINLMHQT